MPNAVEEKLKQAQELFEQACALKADDNLEMAARYFQQACDTLQANPPAPTTSQELKEQYWSQLITYQSDLAKVYKELNNKEKALETYRQIISNHPKVSSVYRDNHDSLLYKKLVEYFISVYKRAAQLLEEKLALKSNNDDELELLDLYKILITYYSSRSLAENNLYRCKLAALYEKLGFWQAARSIYVDVINDIVNCDEKITDRNKDLILSVYKKLAATTAPNTLENEFYLFAGKFISGLSSQNDIKRIFNKIMKEYEGCGVSFLLRYLSHLIKPHAPKYDVINGYFIKLEEEIIGIQEDIEDINEHGLLSVESACLYNTISHIQKNEKDPNNKSIILRMPHYTKETKAIAGYNYYAGQITGKGTFGEVYAVFEWKKFNKANEKPLFAVKVITEPQQFSFKEVLFTDRYLASPYLREQGVQSVHYAENNPLVLTEFITGKPLWDLPGNPKFNNLTFSARINLVTQMLCGFNLLHNNTPATGSAVVHADVSHGNILVSIDEKGKTDARIIDFGNAKVIEDANKQTVPLNWATPTHMAIKDFRDKKIGIKSDIYSLTPVILSLFGVENPMVSKSKILKPVPNEQLRDKIETLPLETAAFDFDDLLKNCPAYLTAVKPYIVLFLERMQNNDYGQRPSSNELLKFFTTLNNYCKLNEKYVGIEEEEGIYKAKMRLLAYGLWEIKLNQATCEHFDFAGNPFFCRTIAWISVEHLNWLKDSGFADLLIHLCSTKSDMRMTQTSIKNLKNLSTKNAKFFVTLSPNTLNLFVCAPEQCKTFLAGLSDPQKLEIYHDLHIYKDAIVTVVGNDAYASAFEEVSKDLVALTNKLETYRKAKQNYAGVMRTLKNMFGSYTAHDKINAAAAALESIKKGNFAKLWDTNTHKPTDAMKALKQGTLGETAKDLVEYVEARMPSLKGGG